ncbi:uncharacterized protein LOC119374561 isoform X1 [Rhipicephalus sanguineus]|uniref:uncharacterized protein LOC119374561 isoform X1 n=1 Tax=Rhipicephalus sanguineus TaxID=34632 RepID=UPI001895112C|nr:uncharacterized protein LOC119374561 isoform X1 [Rhipicephalus sanguineus]
METAQNSGNVSSNSRFMPLLLASCPRKLRQYLVECCQLAFETTVRGLRGFVVVGECVEGASHQVKGTTVSHPLYNVFCFVRILNQASRAVVLGGTIVNHLQLDLPWTLCQVASKSRVTNWNQTLIISCKGYSLEEASAATHARVTSNMAARFATYFVLLLLVVKCTLAAPPMDSSVHSHSSKRMPPQSAIPVRHLSPSPDKQCSPGEHDDYDEEKEVTTCKGFSQESDCQMVVEADGCRRCHCPRACPSIYCGLRCRRVLRSGACPYCDCRRGKQVYVLGKKP